jgi:hypothetical protein
MPSMMTTCTGPFEGTSLRPSCSWIATNSDGDSASGRPISGARRSHEGRPIQQHIVHPGKAGLIDHRASAELLIAHRKLMMVLIGRAVPFTWDACIPFLIMAEPFDGSGLYFNFEPPFASTRSYSGISLVSKCTFNLNRSASRDCCICRISIARSSGVIFCIASRIESGGLP